MIYHIKYQESVYDEIEEVVEYYEKEQKGLGLRLLDAIGQAEQDILMNPLGYQIKYQNYRTRVTWPFPYMLVYEVIGTEIIVYQFFCNLKDPKRKFKK